MSLLTAALIGALVAALATFLVERLGGQKGGILAMLPSTIVPATLLIWTEGGAPLLDAACAATPGGMLLNALFLLLWRLIPSKLPLRDPLTLVIATSLISLSIWAAAASFWVLGLAQLIEAGAPLLVIGLGGQLALIGLGLWSTWSLPAAPAARRTVPWWVYVIRGALTGSAIVAAGFLARGGDGLAAGVASLFPAIMWVSMSSLWLQHGRALPAGAIGPMALGASAVGYYALWAPALYVALGAGWGALTSWLLSILCGSIPAAWWLRRRRASQVGLTSEP